MGSKSYEGLKGDIGKFLLTDRKEGVFSLKGETDGGIQNKEMMQHYRCQLS